MDQLINDLHCATRDDDTETMVTDAATPARQLKERGKHRVLDQFYTRPEIVGMCMDWIAKEFGDLAARGGTWIEPSAGTGAFLDVLPTPRIGIDLDPENRRGDVIEADFMEWKPERRLTGPVTMVGNPPFGRNASLALKFVNRAISLDFDAVCFILPRTFQKEMTKAKVHDLLHCVVDEVLPDNSFIHHGKPYDVPCCFQIWRRMPDNSRRTSEKREMEHSHFKIVGKDDEAHFTFQRVGARAGDVSFEGLQKSWKSHHRILVDEDKATIADVMRDLAGLDDEWAEIRARTAGNPSIGKRELIKHYDDFLVREGRKAERSRPQGDLGF